MAKVGRQKQFDFTLSEQEMMLLKNKELVSEAYQIKDNEIVSKTVQAVLKRKMPLPMADGTKITPTVMEVIAVATVNDAIRRPSTTKLKDLASINNEMKQNIDVSAKTDTGKDLFGDIANKE